MRHSYVGLAESSSRPTARSLLIILTSACITTASTHPPSNYIDSNNNVEAGVGQLKEHKIFFPKTISQKHVQFQDADFNDKQ